MNALHNLIPRNGLLCDEVLQVHRELDNWLFLSVARPVQWLGPHEELAVLRVCFPDTCDMLHKPSDQAIRVCIQLDVPALGNGS